ncbi:TPA: site-specific integrase, partial [Pseudomonas aeruginosa]
MSYTNPRHEGRLILIPNLQDAFAILHVSEAPRGSIESALEGAESNLLYKCDEVGSGNDRALFNFPFLFSANGNPWHEANDYLLSLMRD